MDIIESPQEILTAASTYTKEALETIAKIMRTSDSEKMRLLAAMALLDRAIVPRGHVKRASEQPVLESGPDLRTRLVSHLQTNRGDAFDEHRLKTELKLRSPPSAIRATLVQLNRDGLIAKGPVGGFQAKA